MTISFNFTGRKLIDPSHFNANIKEVAGKFEVEMNWDLSSYSFNSAAQMVILFEGVYEQIIENEGVIANPVGAATVDISRMRNPLDVSITVKIVLKDANNVPVILGLLTHYRPLHNGVKTGEHGILPTKKDADLDVPWRIYTDEGRPILHLTDREELYDHLANSPIFEYCVLTSVVETAFEWLLLTAEDDRDEESVSSWKELFLGLGADPEIFEDQMNPEDFTLEDFGRLRERARHFADRFAREKGLLKQLARIFNEETN